MISKSRGVRMPVRVWLCALMVSLCSAPAFAYVRVTSTTGKPFVWPSGCVAFAAFPFNLFGITTAQFADATTEAARVWTRQDPVLAACTFLELRVTIAAETVTPPAAKYDHLNNILFVTDTWTGDAAALAVTSVVSLTTGELVDTDIQVNAVDFRWADLVAAPNGTGSQDLQNALTHEMGHAIGLGHTCFVTGAKTRPTDQNGNPIPDCSAASDAIRETTMFPSATPRDISKRTLAPDDQQAVCDIYPLAADPGKCALAADAGVTPSDASQARPDAAVDQKDNTDHGGCSCTTTGRGPRGGLAILFLLLSGLSVRRRSRRPRH